MCIRDSSFWSPLISVCQFVSPGHNKYMLSSPGLLQSVSLTSTCRRRAKTGVMTPLLGVSYHYLVTARTVAKILLEREKVWPSVRGENLEYWSDSDQAEVIRIGFTCPSREEGRESIWWIWPCVSLLWTITEITRSIDPLVKGVM